MTMLTGMSAIDIQNAPTGRTSVIPTHAAGINPETRTPALPVMEKPIMKTSSAAARTTACGVHSARARSPSDSLRVSTPSVRIGPIGR